MDTNANANANASAGTGTAVGAGTAVGNGGRSARTLWVVGVVLALVLAGFVSFYASSSPDGLEKVAADHGIDEKAEEHALGNSPLADYRTEDVDDARLSGGLAGVVGVGATLAVGTGVFWLVRRRPAAPAARNASSAPAPAADTRPKV